MKKTYFLTLLLVVFISASLFSQPVIPLNDQRISEYYYTNSQNILVVSGRIVHIPDSVKDKLAVSYTLISPLAFGSPVALTTPVAVDGTFNLAIKNIFPYQQVMVSIGKYFKVPIVVTKELVMEIDLSIMPGTAHKITEAVKFSGIDRELNAFYIDFTTFKREKTLQSARKRFALRLNLNPTQERVIQILDSIRQEDKIWMDDYFKMNISANKFRWVVDQMLESEYSIDILSFASRKGEKVQSEVAWKTIYNHKTYFYDMTEHAFYDGISKYIVLSGKGLNTTLPEYGPKLINKHPEMPASLRDSLQNYLTRYTSISNKHDLDTLAKQIAPRLRKLYISEIRLSMYDSKMVLADSLLPQYTAELVKLQFCPKDVEAAKYFFVYFKDEFSSEWINKSIGNQLRNFDLKTK